VKIWFCRVMDGWVVEEGNVLVGREGAVMMGTVLVGLAVESLDRRRYFCFF
jgi:hypothetical protein